MSTFPPPPHSRSAVKRAGKAISEGVETDHDIDLVDQWRSAHGYVINTFQIFFKRRIVKRSAPAEFAQRLKRRRTVIDKLHRRRNDGQPLIADVTSMHDFAGCRLIFQDIESLVEFRSYVNSPESMKNVKHKLRHGLEKYDYIERPKSSGYRGIHDIYFHHPRPHRHGDMSAPWQGLLVEVQYRTRVQHAWATALEISDIIDGQRTKFELSETERVRFFALASEVLARHHEHKSRAFVNRTLDDLIGELNELESHLGILRRLDALKQYGGLEKIRRHNVLNIKSVDGGSFELEVFAFQNASQAIEKATELEKDPDSVNAVYVSADNPSQLRSAYRNYFNDPVDFVQLIREATWKA